MSRSITSAIRISQTFARLEWCEQFSYLGFIVLPGALTPSLVKEARCIFDRYAAHYFQASYAATITNGPLSHRKMVFRALEKICQPSIAALLNEYRAFSYGFAVKQASGSRCTLDLHRDITMVPLGGRPGITVWIPLVDTTELNGCLNLVAGSHRLALGPRSLDTPFSFTNQQETLRSKYLTPIRVAAGDAIVFDQSLVHGSGGNYSNRVRPCIMGMLAPREKQLVFYDRVENRGRVWLKEYRVRDSFYINGGLVAPACRRERVNKQLERLDICDWSRLVARPTVARLLRGGAAHGQVVCERFGKLPVN